MSIANVNPYGEFQKAHLRGDDLDKFIWEQGIRVSHYKSVPCPHVSNLQNNHGDITCNVCDNGRITFDPKTLFATFTQRKLEELFKVEGLWQMGDALVTFPSKYEDGSVVRVDFFDKLELIDFAERASDLIKKSNSDIDKLRYKAKDVLILRTKSTVYTKDTDFIINTNGDIQWISGNRPTVGTIYTLGYLFAPIYRVVNFLHEQRYYYDSLQSTVKTPRYLPIQAQVRRDYFIDERKNYD